MTSVFVPRPNLRSIVARFAHPLLYPWARMVLRRANPPVRTGRLRASGKIVPTRDGLRVQFDATNEGFRYAAVVEKRRPFLRPAIRR